MPEIQPPRAAAASLPPGLVVRELSAVMGAEIRGAALADFTPQLADAVKALFLKHHVLVFRDQQIVDADMERFARSFGPLEVNQVRDSGGGGVLPAVHSIANVDAQGRPAANPLLKSNFHWHSDKSYLPQPSLMTMLYGLEVPPSGGDTQFSNMELAYDDLPAAMKERLRGLKVVQSFEHMLDTLGQRHIIDPELIPPPVAHPLVRTHPETGRKSLFVGMYSREIPGLPPQEARRLIAELVAHATQEQYTYTHRWKPNDFVCWDNRSLVHRAIANYEMSAHRRVLRRCVVRGGVPQ